MPEALSLFCLLLFNIHYLLFTKYKRSPSQSHDVTKSYMFVIITCHIRGSDLLNTTINIFYINVDNADYIINAVFVINWKAY